MPEGMSGNVVPKIRLPDEVIEYFRQLLDSAESTQWKIGRGLVDLVDEMSPVWERSGVKHARAAIIRQLAVANGVSDSTLRDRESMARFYPPEVQAEYAVLTYHQLRACKSAGEQWRCYADWAVSNLPAPVALIRARVKCNGDLPPAWIGRWERLQELAELLVGDDLTPDDVKDKVKRLGGE